jgi:hypothetical protein
MLIRIYSGVGKCWHGYTISIKHVLMFLSLYPLLISIALGEESHNLIITGLVPSPSGGLAVINGKYSSVGDVINGYTVLKISDSSVSFGKDGRTFDVQVQLREPANTMNEQSAIQDSYWEKEKLRIQKIKEQMPELTIQQRYMEHGGKGILVGPLLVKKHGTVESGDAGHPSRSIEGVVVNLSDDVLSYVTVRFKIFDIDGNVVESPFDIIDGLKPQESWKYKAIILYDDAIYKYEFDTATFSK